MSRYWRKGLISLSSNVKEFHAISPLNFFSGEKFLLDPHNLNFIPEYYLLENLSSGLICSGKNKYIPSLADSWDQVSNTEWIFKIRKNICWSDGSPISPEQILFHFNELKHKKYRHILILKNLDHIDWDAKKNHLYFKFKSLVNESLLRELCLAEAGILNTQNLKDDWATTSGAYFVESKNKDQLVLKTNDYFLFKIQIKKINIHPSPFPNFDVRKRPVYAFRAVIEKLAETAKTIRSKAAYIYYFSFNAKHSAIVDKQKRKALARFMYEAFHEFKYKDILTSNHQMIPNEYVGHLDVDPTFKTPLQSLQKEELILELNEYLTTVLPEVFETCAKKHKINLKLLFKSEPTQTPFAIFGNFLGNQKDPLSSWQYLYGEGGPLHFFYPEVKDLFEQIISAEGETRNQLLLDLHRKTLEEAYVVPFLAEYDAILASDRVDLSNINPYDMRLRFFEMKWKKS